jgi:hypothetical protein
MISMSKNAQNPLKQDRESTRRLVLRILLLLLLFAALVCGYVLIKKPALKITVENLDKQTATFLLISTLKSSLAIIEGSDVGIGFRLELGDIVQSTYDLIDFTWKIIIYGIIVVTFCKILFESNIMDIGVYILGAGFVISILSFFIHAYKKSLLTFGTGIIIAGLIISFYIPISAIVSFHTSEYFVEHIEKDMDRQMEEVYRDWEKYKEQFSLSNFKSSVTSSGRFIKNLFVKLTGVLITYTCLLLIKYLFFPLIVAYGFFIISKTFLKRVLPQGATPS